MSIIYIRKKNNAKRDAFIVEKNEEQVKIAMEKLAKWKNKKAIHPDSQTVQRRISYLDTVLSEFDNWFQNRGIKSPVSSNPKKKKWKKSKDEFARFVCEKIKSTKSGKKDTKIVEQYYNNYEFPFEWTLEKCKQYVRQVKYQPQSIKKSRDKK